MQNSIYNIYKLLKQWSITPRWVIFSLDLVICGISLFYANILRFNFDYQLIQRNNFAKQILFVTGLNILFFMIFRTYEGIIRISGLKEGLRCVRAIFYSFVLLTCINVVCSIFGLKYVVPYSILIIYFFTSAVLIYGYRILAKHLYWQSVRHDVKLQNVIVIGAGNNSSLLKHALEHSSGDKVDIVAFIEENPKLWHKTIENVKIYPTSQIKQIVKSKQVKSIFIADENRDINLKNELIDFCLANNIVLKIIPALQNWIDGELNVRQLKDVKIEDLLNRPTIHLAKDHIQKYIKSKRVLITGAAGSIGSEITRQIAAIDPEILILCDQTETGLYELEYELEQMSGVKKSYKIYVGDIRDKKNMHHLFASYHPEIVIHAAAYKHVPLMEKNASEAIKNNVLGTKILVDLSEKFAVERFLFISTDKAINPTNVMGASKRVAELYIEAIQKKYTNSHAVNGYYDYKLNGENGHSNKRQLTKFIITRFGNVLGSNGSVIPRFKQQIDMGGPLTVTHPDITRFFMTIPEACSLVLEAGTMGKGGEIFIFDMGEPVKIIDLAHKMIKLAGFIPGKDIRIEYSGLRPGEKLYEEFMHDAEKLIPTHNKKIMITQGNNYDYESIKKLISKLIETASNNENIEVVKQMKFILPEYKSKNSHFEILDEKSSLISI